MNSFFFRLIGLISGQKKQMEDSCELILGNIIKLTRSSEKKFKLGNFKGALEDKIKANEILKYKSCLLYTSPSPRDKRQSRMPSSA